MGSLPCPEAADDTNIPYSHFLISTFMGSNLGAGRKELKAGMKTRRNEIREKKKKGNQEERDKENGEKKRKVNEKDITTLNKWNSSQINDLEC